MQRRSTHVVFHHSPELCRRLGAGIAVAERRALAVLASLGDPRREVVHLQVEVDGLPVAFSSRWTKAGHLAVDLDIGDPRLAGRVVFEDGLRVRATCPRPPRLPVRGG